MDQELEAVVNSSPRLITPETWAFLIDFAHSSPMPVTTNFMEYMFDVCTLYSLPPSIPCAAALLLHHLHGISLLEGWTGQQLFLVAVIIAAKFLCKYPSPPRNGWWSVCLFGSEGTPKLILSLWVSLMPLVPTICLFWGGVNITVLGICNVAPDFSQVSL